MQNDIRGGRNDAAFSDHIIQSNIFNGDFEH